MLRPDSVSILRTTPWPARAAAALLLIAFVVQAAWASRRDSVTIDEFVHLPVGIHALYTGDYSLDPINPPFPRMIAALPMLFVAPAFAPEQGTSHWGMGYHLMDRNAAEYQEIFVAARAMVIGMAVLLGLLVWHWSTVLYGWRSALIALTFFAFSPTMLAHGHLVTLDMSGGLGFTLAAYAIWKMLGTPTFGRAVLAGAAFAIAALLKLSGSVLVVAVVVATAVRVVSSRTEERPLGALTAFGLLVTMGLTSLLLLNLAYGFDGTLALLSEARLDPAGSLAALVESFPGIRLPFPQSYVEGVDMVMNVGVAVEPSYFLNGELTSEGWWYYHFAAFFYKTPMPLLIAATVALVAWPWTRVRGAREYCLWLPVALIFFSNTAFNSLQIGVRHVLPAYPLLFVFISGRLGGIVEPVEAGQSTTLAHRAGAVVVAGLLLWFVAGTVAVGPRYFQYFNAWAGGAEGGHEHLVDSNIDWGQDLLRLSEYMKENRIDEIQLAYFGRVDPEVYGINYVALEPPGRDGLAAVSATFLMGRPYFWVLGGRMRWVPSNTYTWLQTREPIARVGSMFIYDLN
jgi:hypothetical protein